MYHAASKGKWLTQHPFGYRLENKELVIYENEAKLFEIYSFGTHKKVTVLYNCKN